MFVLTKDIKGEKAGFLTPRSVVRLSSNVQLIKSTSVFGSDRNAVPLMFP